MVSVDLLSLVPAGRLLQAGTGVICYSLDVLGIPDSSTEGTYVLENTEVTALAFISCPYCLDYAVDAALIRFLLTTPR